MTAFTLFALYRAPLNVWVEDPLSHRLLAWTNKQAEHGVSQPT